MRLFSNTDWRLLTVTPLCLALCALSGCAIIGPSSIRMGRATYNEVINRTDDEQMLLSIIKGRYGETYSLLAVGSVAANFSFSANAGAEFGIGPRENYVGNLVPLAGGLAYEENPTITYQPVQGEKYLHQFLSPIRLETMVLILRAVTNPAMYFTALVNRVNDMRNPDFLEAPSAEPDLRFERFAKLTEELMNAGIIQWLVDPRKDVPIDILITDFARDYSEMVRTYLSMLGLHMPKDTSEDIVIPVYFAVKGREPDGIAISTRSTFDLIEILRAAVEIPQQQADQGLARDYPISGLAGKDIRIHASKDKPSGAVVAVRHRGYWFYISETDMHTKLFFSWVKTLWSVSIASAAKHTGIPLLTIPVSR